MKRRTLGLLAGTSLLALRVGKASAQTAPDASLLTTTLTPMGGERAGNADGSIPAWTGGATTLPAGLKPNDYVPELFPDEQPVVVISASNMADHADRLSEGLMAMMTKYGYSIKVYPTHRTAAAPQYVYDNIAKNVTRATLDAGGGRLGFHGGYGGVPFPIPNISDPLTAGAQIMWNHEARWLGYEYVATSDDYVVSNGQLAFASGIIAIYTDPYYDPNGSPETYNGVLQASNVSYYGPANLVGQKIIDKIYSDSYINEQQAWELLNGQGRVRRAPEITFDTPASQADGIANYDEYYGIDGSLERYDLKYLEKKEMYIPYNNNKLHGASAQEAHLAHFMNPDLMRWELHRVWVVEATLHPGERNVLARRKFYCDEDTFMTGVIDEYDGSNNLYRFNIITNYCRPDFPGVFYGSNIVHNLQTDDYVTLSGFWNQGKKADYLQLSNVSPSLYDPQNLAASGQY